MAYIENRRLWRVYRGGDKDDAVVYPWEPDSYQCDSEEGDVCVEIGIEEATLEDFYTHFDNEAESANYHSFVGLHEYLAKLLEQEVGRAAATRIFAKLFIRSESGLLDDYLY